ncbi:MAG: hypothetical protein PGN09_00015 [Sphingomonas fennica]
MGVLTVTLAALLGRKMAAPPPARPVIDMKADRVCESCGLPLATIETSMCDECWAFHAMRP